MNKILTIALITLLVLGITSCSQAPVELDMPDDTTDDVMTSNEVVVTDEVVEEEITSDFIDEEEEVEVGSMF